jgi:hypothetical protein
MGRFRFLYLMATIALLQPITVYAQLAPRSVSGVVSSSQRGPLAGVTIYLVNPVGGRSAPSFSDSNGKYIFVNVPEQTQPYFIEAYWGSQLLYRTQLPPYQGTPLQKDIQLP